MNTAEQLLSEVMNQQQMHSTEGQAGVRNLCILSNMFGYCDPQRWGDLGEGVCIGDLLKLLECNPGAVQALIDWMHQQPLTENLKNNLQAHLLRPVDDDAGFDVEVEVDVHGHGHSVDVYVNGVYDGLAGASIAEKLRSKTFNTMEDPGVERVIREVLFYDYDPFTLKIFLW